MEENKIPEGVINEEAYISYIETAKHPILNEKRLHICSDDTEIDLGMLPHHLKKKIAHLPDKEQNKLMTLKQLYFKKNNSMSALKRLAFGVKLGSSTMDTGFLAERKEEIIEYFGRMFTVEELMKVITQDWKMEVSVSALYNFRKNNATEIEKRIERFRASHSDIRLTVKRSRIEELVWAYARQKDKWKLSQSREDLKVMLSILEQVRKESEGEQLTVNGRLDISYEADVNKHLRDEIFRTMNLKEIILGRVASKMNVSSIKLINSLNNSHYARWSNVLGGNDNVEDIDYIPVFPSTQNYDFDKIKKLNEAEEKNDNTPEPESGKDPKKAMSIKDALLAKLKGKKEDMAKKVGEINANTAQLDKDRTGKVKIGKPKS